MVRLYNGDCLEVMDSLIEEGIKVDQIITDPPYGTVKGLAIDGWISGNGGGPLVGTLLLNHNYQPQRPHHY